MNDELEEWVRDRTSVRERLGPRHCLSNIYQPWNPDSQFPGLPAFAQRLPRRKTTPDWPSADSEEVVIPGSEEWEKAQHKLDIRRIQLIRETWNEFAEPLSGENTSKGGLDAADRRKNYQDLNRKKKSMRASAERDADAIDEGFQVTDPSSGNETTALAQAFEIYLEVKRLRDEHGPDTLLRENFSAEVEKLDWRGRIDFVGPVQTGLSHPQRDAYSQLGSLTEILTGIGGEKERPCFRTEDMGFKCGLEWVPADATLGEVAKLFELHFTGVEDEARELGNTHALLSYRLQMLEAVLYEYDLYENVETTGIAETTEVTWPHDREDLNDSRYKIDLELFLEKVKGALESSEIDTRSEVWNTNRHIPTVSYSGLKRELPMEALKKSGGGHIERQAIRQNVEKHFDDVHLRRLRDKAFLNA